MVLTGGSFLAGVGAAVRVILPTASLLDGEDLEIVW